MLGVLAASVALTALILGIKKKKSRSQRRFWVNPFLMKRSEHGRYFSDFVDMRDWKPEFSSNFHMEHEVFNELYQRLCQRLQAKRHTRPDAIDPKQRLAYTLEYLSGGPFFERYSASNYRISKSSSANIIRETCQIIYEELSSTEFMKYEENNWLDVSNEYYEKWNMPNCLGAIDGKHIKIKCPPNAGSLYFNYKRFHSIILMAACDASYKFTFVDIGSPGADGDMNVFARTDFGANILCDDVASLHFPPDLPIDGIETPFFFLGDDAFPLNRRLMKPFGSKRGPLPDEEKGFNYRLSRARRTIENAFGVLTMRWGCLRSEFLCSPDKVKIIVAACCALHNFLIKRSNIYASPPLFDRFNENGQLIEGGWRRNLNVQLEPVAIRRGRPNSKATQIRERLKKFFFHTDILPYQFIAAHCNIRGNVE